MQWLNFHNHKCFKLKFRNFLSHSSIFMLWFTVSNPTSCLSQNHRITEHLSWKQQIPHEFEADWEYVVSTAMVHQLRAHQYLRQMIASVAGSLSFNKYSLWVLFLLENENNFRNIHYWIFLSKITNINRYCLSISQRIFK